MTGEKPGSTEALYSQILMGLVISNGPGAISAPGAKGAADGASPYVFSVNAEAIIAALLLVVLWTDYQSGALMPRSLETAAFTVFLFGRMIGQRQK